MLARFGQDGQTAYVAIAVGQISADIHVIEVKNMDVGMVTLDARGYGVVEGIYFDTDKATLKAESASAIGEMAKLLSDRPKLSVYVVGHTDMQGEYAHNRTVSENRANTVVEELATEYEITRERMRGYGVGSLAPQASNSSDAGRAKNRIVVLVAR